MTMAKVPDYKPKLIKDPVHGSIQLHPLLVSIINTEAFNRLKYTRQNGGLYYVYPGATHTRFEHSIGVSYLAGEFARMLQRKQRDEIDKLKKDLKKKESEMITEREILCLEVAGLCHDLGHGPFSHVFDGKVLNKLGYSKEPLKHEDISLMIFEKEIFVKLKKHFEDEGVELPMIKSMIAPNVDDKTSENYCGDKDRMFLYEIVANKLTGIDVDKWDYFIRDCHYMGLKCEFDWKRLMQLSYIREVDFPSKGEDKCKVKRICYSKKEKNNILGMFRTRASLYDKAIRHHTVVAVEHRLSSAMLAVKNLKMIHIGKEALSMADIFDQVSSKQIVTGYLALTDCIIHVILNMSPAVNSTEPGENLIKAQASLKKLFTRDIFRRVSPDKVKDVVKETKSQKDAVKETKSQEDVVKETKSQEVQTEDAGGQSLHQFLLDVVKEAKKKIHESEPSSSSSSSSSSKKAIHDIVEEYLKDKGELSSPIADILLETCRYVQRETGESYQDGDKAEKKMLTILLQIIPHAVNNNTKAISVEDLSFEEETLSYGSEKRCKEDGPLLDENSEILFIFDEKSPPRPLTKEEASELFFPKKYTETEVWIYYDKIKHLKEEDIIRAVKDVLTRKRDT